MLVDQELETGVYWGDLAWYGGGGFVQNLAATNAESLAILRVSWVTFQ